MRTLFLLAILACFVSHGVAQEFCAVTILVSDERARPLAIPVELLEPSGKAVAWSTTSHEGKAEFCDFGFGYHSIVINKGHCNSITIHKVRFYYPIPNTFRFVLPRCEETGDVLGSACRAYFRVMSENGLPVAGVAVRIEGQQKPLRGDTYGRVLAGIPFDKTVPTEVTFSAAGYETEVLRVACEKRSDIEQAVQLKRRKSQDTRP